MNIFRIRSFEIFLLNLSLTFLWIDIKVTPLKLVGPFQVVGGEGGFPIIIWYFGAHKNGFSNGGLSEWISKNDVFINLHDFTTTQQYQSTNVPPSGSLRDVPANWCCSLAASKDWWIQTYTRSTTGLKDRLNCLAFMTIYRYVGSCRYKSRLLDFISSGLVLKALKKLMPFLTLWCQKCNHWKRGFHNPTYFSGWTHTKILFGKNIKP